MILPFYDELIPEQQAVLELPGSGADRIEEMLRRVLAVCADHDDELTILHYDWSHLVEIDELAGVIAAATRRSTCGNKSSTWATPTARFAHR